MKDVYYQVKVTQEIPYWSGDDEFDLCESSGRVEEYVAGSFPSEHLARVFAEALGQKIAEGSGYVVSAFTPKVTVLMVSRSVKEI